MKMGYCKVQRRLCWSAAKNKFPALSPRQEGEGGGGGNLELINAMQTFNFHVEVLSRAFEPCIQTVFHPISKPYSMQQRRIFEPSDSMAAGIRFART